MSIVDWIYPKKCVGCGIVGLYICENCRKMVEVRGRSLRYEGVVRKAIKEIKYRGAYDMVKELISLWEQSVGKRVDMQNMVVTAVPMWRKKQRKRGFNQAELMARELARIWNLSYENLLIRSRDTKPMYGLSKIERTENVRNAFAVMEGKDVHGREIILIDDVWTTGSSCGECEQVLIKNGAKRIIVETLAR